MPPLTPARCRVQIGRTGSGRCIGLKRSATRVSCSALIKVAVMRTGRSRRLLTLPSHNVDQHEQTLRECLPDIRVAEITTVLSQPRTPVLRGKSVAFLG